MARPKTLVQCCAIFGQPKRGLRRLSSQMARISSREGPRGPGFVFGRDEERNRYLELLEATMKAQQGGGLEENGRADQPTKAQELGTKAQEHALDGAKIGRSAAGAPQDQKPLLQEDILSQNGSGSARSEEKGQSGHADAPTRPSHFSWPTSLRGIALGARNRIAVAALLDYEFGMYRADLIPAPTSFCSRGAQQLTTWCGWKTKLRTGPWREEKKSRTSPV
jgi:hypothetical protein